MGNSNNFLGLMAGAYNNQQEQERRKKEADRRDKEWKWKEEEREQIRESRHLAPIVKPFVPQLYPDPTGAQTFEASLPTGQLGNIVDAAGMTGLAGAPGVGPLLPDNLTVKNFETGDQLAARQKADSNLAREIQKKRMLVDEGLIRDYNKFPVGYRSSKPKSSPSKAGWKSTSLYSETGSKGSDPESLAPETMAPQIKPFKPYQSFEEVLYEGKPEEQEILQELFLEQNDIYKSSSQAQKNALAILNRERKNVRSQQIQEAKERQRKEKLAAMPDIPPTPEEDQEILHFLAGKPLPKPSSAPPFNQIASFPPPQLPAINTATPQLEPLAPPVMPQIASSPSLYSQPPMNNTKSLPQLLGSQNNMPSPIIASSGMNVSPNLPNMSSTNIATPQSPLKQQSLPQRQEENFRQIVNLASMQLKRPLSDSEKGFFAQRLFGGSLSDVNFDWNKGTFRLPGNRYESPLQDLISNELANYRAENSFQSVADKVTPVFEPLENWGQGNARQAELQRKRGQQPRSIAQNMYDWFTGKSN
jgi:hypothetical protein